MNEIIKVRDTVGQFFTHGWGHILLAIATLIGGLAAIDYFCDSCLKTRLTIIIFFGLTILIIGMVATNHFCNGCLKNRLARMFGEPKFSSLRIVLLYKHDTEPDESAVNTLETLLTTTGHHIFINRENNLEQLQGELKQVDAVVVLLTSASAFSDALCEKVELACRIAKDQANHKPHLIPLWVQFEGPLQYQQLANLLASRPPIYWRKIADDSLFMPELLRRLTQSPAEQPCGAMPVDSPFYVERQVDQKLQFAIAKSDCIIQIHGPRQVGKTSLLARGLKLAREEGKQVWVTDCQTLGETAFQDIKTFCRMIAYELTAQARVKLSVDRLWNDKLTPEIAFESYLCTHLLPKVKQPVVWAIDEADLLLQQPFCGSIFGKFRGWFNARSLQPNHPGATLLAKLTLIIVYATEYHLFITDPLQSPFNVGEKLTLEDFTIEQVATLNQRYDSLLNAEELQQFYGLVGGHPYLVRLGLHNMRNDRLTFTEFTRQATLERGLFGDHLRRMVTLLDRDPDLCEVLRKVLRGQPCPDELAFDRLHSGGILKGNSKNEAQLRCELYAQYLTQQLL